MNYRAYAPQEFRQHYDNMPNAVRALYCRFRQTDAPWREKEEELEAWGQLCFDKAAAGAAAYHMWNKGMRTGWAYVSWRVEMDTVPVGGGKLSGDAPEDFSLTKYGPPCAAESQP